MKAPCYSIQTGAVLQLGFLLELAQLVLVFALLGVQGRSLAMQVLPQQVALVAVVVLGGLESGESRLLGRFALLAKLPGLGRDALALPSQGLPHQLPSEPGLGVDSAEPLRLLYALQVLPQPLQAHPLHALLPGERRWRWR